MWWNQSDSKSQQQRIQREIAKRQKRGESFVVLEAPAGSKKLCTTFWAQAWCRHLESYQVYESRLPRGRSYLRQGKVYDLTIEPGMVSAIVAGSELYETQIHIQPLPLQRWRDLVAASVGEVSSMLDLLAGKLGDSLLHRLIDPQQGLFPQPKEIRFNCSCPDHADMCKHVSAVLYGVAVQLDTQPELLFTLRKVDQAELLADASASAITELGSGTAELGDADLSALFGIDLGSSIEIPESIDLSPPPAAKKRAAKKRV